jgi:hypothetical protein
MLGVSRNSSLFSKEKVEAAAVLVRICRDRARTCQGNSGNCGKKLMLFESKRRAAARSGDKIGAANTTMHNMCVKGVVATSPDSLRAGSR